MTVVAEGRMSVLFCREEAHSLVSDGERVFPGRAEAGCIRARRVHDAQHIEACWPSRRQWWWNEAPVWTAARAIPPRSCGPSRREPAPHGSAHEPCGEPQAVPRSQALGRVLLWRSPALCAAMVRRGAGYDVSLDPVAAMERAGSAFVLRPVRPL